MDIENSLLVVIDVQAKLAHLMHQHEELLLNIRRGIEIANVLEVPILWTEQAPDKIGSTTEEIASLLTPIAKPIHKRSFSCFGEPQFRDALDKSNRKQILLIGIETHVCVYQTARDLLKHGYDVFVAQDAVSSKTEIQKTIAINRMRKNDIQIVSLEMIGCEWMVDANHPKFRDVMINIKR